MKDLTMCSGLHCPAKNKCLRAICKKTENQLWYDDIPFNFEMGECEMFIKAKFI